MPTSGNSIWVFSVTWFANLDSQSIAHKAFEKVAKRFLYQWETAPTTGASHCQGYLNLRNKSFHTGRALAKSLSMLGMKGVTCKAASDNGKEQLKAYCMKDDTRLAGPWADRVIYQGQDLVCMKTPFPWQESILELVRNEPNDRDIIWINDHGGNVGKTKLLKYMCYNKLAKRIPLGNATQIKTNVIVQGAARCYCVDLPRTTGSTEKMQDLISAIEEIKGGWVSSAMYGKHQEIYMDSPHVLVFTNCAPPLHMMSRDRWTIYTVESRKLARVARNNIVHFT